MGLLKKRRRRKRPNIHVRNKRKEPKKGIGTNYGWKLAKFVRDIEPTYSRNLANLNQDNSKFMPRLVIIELLENKDK